MNISTILSNAGLSDTRPTGNVAAGQTGPAGKTGASGQIEGAKGLASDSYGGASSGDQVSLSGVSQILNSGTAQRTAMLASLTSSVQSGSYGVSSSAVGGSMISEMLARSGGSW